MNLKKENTRLCWDGSNKDSPDDWAVNDNVDMEDNPLITFGNSKSKFMTDVYNIRIDHPGEEIWLGTADVKACFRTPKLHPDITGTFSFMIGFMNCFFVMTAMVFGYKSSTNSWEPFRRAIEIMSIVCSLTNTKTTKNRTRTIWTTLSLTNYHREKSPSQRL